MSVTVASQSELQSGEPQIQTTKTALVQKSKSAPWEWTMRQQQVAKQWEQRNQHTNQTGERILRFNNIEENKDADRKQAKQSTVHCNCWLGDGSLSNQLTHAFRMQPNRKLPLTIRQENHRSTLPQHSRTKLRMIHATTRRKREIF